MWLTNDGLKSTDTLLTFGEAGEVLKFIARLADAVQDPLEAKRKLSRLDAADQA